MNEDGQKEDATIAIEVTPEMLEVGWQVLRESGLVEWDSEPCTLLLADIFRAMLSRSPASCAKSRMSFES